MIPKTSEHSRHRIANLDKVAGACNWSLEFGRVWSLEKIKS